MGLAAQEISARDFLKILKRNGFADKDTKVKGGRVEISTGLGTYRHRLEFNVITKCGLNIGNLVSIEEQYGLALVYVKPQPDGNLYIIFAEENQDWFRGFKRI